MRITARGRLLGVVALVSLLSLWTGAAPGADDSGKPDATIEFEAASAAVGIGYSWGKGVLHYKGKSHPFKVSGLTAGELGGTKVNARGEVYHLNKLEDFSGLYTSSGAGATAAGGFDVEAMRSGKGVEIKVVSTTQGLDIKAAISGIKFTLE